MYDVNDRSQSGLRERQRRNEGRKRGHGRDHNGEPAVDRSTPAGAADGAAEVFARMIDLADDPASALRLRRPGFAAARGTDARVELFHVVHVDHGAHITRRRDPLGGLRSRHSRAQSDLT